MEGELHILQHALGLDEYGRGTMYRNRFVTGAGSIDHPACLALVEQGFMTRRANVELFGGDDIFTVTDAGKIAVVANSPVPPKLTPSQQRYQAYLDADSSETFGDWLKMKSRQKAMEAGRL